MKNLSMYDKAHLIVSAVRLLEFKNKGLPPFVKDISELLNASEEEILFVSRKLEDKKIINIIEKDRSFKISINDHTIIESLPKVKDTSKLDSQLEEFKEKQKNKSKEIEEFQKKQKEKQKQLFDKLNKELQSVKK